MAVKQLYFVLGLTCWSCLTCGNPSNNWLHQLRITHWERATLMGWACYPYEGEPFVKEDTFWRADGQWKMSFWRAEDMLLGQIPHNTQEDRLYASLRLVLLTLQTGDSSAKVPWFKLRQLKPRHRTTACCSKNWMVNTVQFHQHAVFPVLRVGNSAHLNSDNMVTYDILKIISSQSYCDAGT